MNQQLIIYTHVLKILNDYHIIPIYYLVVTIIYLLLMNH